MLTLMQALFFAVLFLVHAVIFFRLYKKDPHRIHLILTVSGFVHLAMYYGYRAYAYFGHPAEYFDWITYLRWSGLAMSALGLAPRVKARYARMKARNARAVQPATEADSDNRPASSAPTPT